MRKELTSINNLKELAAILGTLIPLIVAGIVSIIAALGKNNKKVLSLLVENETLKKEIEILKKEITQLKNYIEKNNINLERK